MTEFVIGMLIFDGMTHLDLAGPLDALARIPNARVELVSRTGEPVISDLKFEVPATHSFTTASSPKLLFVGGGPGVNKLMEDEETLAFLRNAAETADWVTSVCTGALVLASAGLLRGYRAATHWTAIEALAALGVEVSTERVVVDRNRITGGGVTAGIDFGLRVIDILLGKEAAQASQLGMEYNPAPPYCSGSPAEAPPEIVERVRARTAQITSERISIARRVAGAAGWA